MPQSLAAVFRGRNILWFLLAFALTFGIVVSGLDWQYFLWTRSPVLHDLFFPAVIVGGLLPILLPIITIGIGHLRRNQIVIRFGWALGQAAVLGLFISSALKAFTGRIHPDMGNIIDDISRGFQFGFLRGGVFWGWPSSHTTVAFALACAAWVLLVGKGRLAQIARWIFLIYAFYVGLGVSMSIHWLSEFGAGAIIGAVIGTAVGRTFKNK